MERRRMCKYCGSQTRAADIYCAKCEFEVIWDMIEGDVTAAYEDGVITKEEYIFILGLATAPATKADEKRFSPIMKKVDGEE
jgi:hypothetical protein